MLQKLGVCWSCPSCGKRLGLAQLIGWGRVPPCACCGTALSWAPWRLLTVNAAALLLPQCCLRGASTAVMLLASLLVGGAGLRFLRLEKRAVRRPPLLDAGRRTARR